MLNASTLPQRMTAEALSLLSVEIIEAVRVGEDPAEVLRRSSQALTELFGCRDRAARALSTVYEAILASSVAEAA